MSDKKTCGCGCMQQDIEKKEQAKEDTKKEK